MRGFVAPKQVPCAGWVQRCSRTGDEQQYDALVGADLFPTQRLCLVRRVQRGLGRAEARTDRTTKVGMVYTRHHLESRGRSNIRLVLDSEHGYEVNTNVYANPAHRHQWTDLSM